MVQGLGFLVLGFQGFKVLGLGFRVPEGRRALGSKRDVVREGPSHP